MSGVNCLGCGHDIYYVEPAIEWDEYKCAGYECTFFHQDGAQCSCRLSPADIAYALLTAEPTEAEVGAFKSAWESTPAGEPGARTRAGLKAAAEARR